MKNDEKTNKVNSTFLLESGQPGEGDSNSPSDWSPAGRLNYLKALYDLKACLIGVETSLMCESESNFVYQRMQAREAWRRLDSGPGSNGEIKSKRSADS